MDGWSGHLLIAPAWMSDPHFAHSLVLILQHDGQGAFGLALNRPTGTTVEEVWKQVTGEACALEGPLYLGGPVAGPLFALHERADLGQETAVEGLYLSTDPQQLAQLLAEPPPRLRLFAGYSGWGGSQLERELQDAAWVTTPATADDAFCAAGEPIWRAALLRATVSAQDPLGQAPPAPPPPADTN